MITEHYIKTALQNWIPCHLFFEEGQALCRWLFTGDAEFTEPFFDETIGKCKHSLPRNSSRVKCISDISILPEWSQHIESIRPTAFIFHVSRCGSTLASQLLGLNRENIVLSEVPFFDELLRWKRKTSPADEAGSSQLLKAAINFYAAKRNPVQQRVFIKADSWHIFFYEQIRNLFPQTPFILLYRQPVEVIRSQQKRRGMQAVPGMIEPELFGFSQEEIINISLDEYMAKVLEKYFHAFLAITEKDPLAFPVNYQEGPVAIVEKIAKASGFSITEKEMNDMKQRANYHAKYPDQFFSEEAVQTIAPGYTDKVVALYKELEAIRKGVIPCRQE